MYRRYMYKRDARDGSPNDRDTITKCRIMRAILPFLSVLCASQKLVLEGKKFVLRLWLLIRRTGRSDAKIAFGDLRAAPSALML